MDCITSNCSGGAHLLVAENLSKEYSTPRGPLPILSDVNLSLQRGQALAVVGPSGSGKSTLLYVLGALEPPSSGRVTLDGRNPYELPEKELAALRNREVGFVFQDHFLLPQCSVLENVLTPALVWRNSAAPKPDFAARARELLTQVGLAERLEHRPAELSGGEKQRVALARALVCGPSLLLCDEPTGSLDRASADVVAEMLFGLHQQQKTILVVVTHNTELAARFPARYELRNRTLVKV